MIAELAQCSCGIIFTVPFPEDDEFVRHIKDDTHRRCLNIEVCGPCFVGGCASCEIRRRLGQQIWRCRCMHEINIRKGKRKFGSKRLDEVKHVWSNWLISGRPSGESLGLESRQ